MSIYQNCYDLIHTYIYGGVTMGSEMELVCILLATMACVFLFACPFILVWKIIRMI